MEQFDKLLKEALIEYEKEEARANEPANPEEIPDFSPEFEARMEKMLSGRTVSKHSKRRKKIWKKAAVAAGFLLVISTFRPVQEVYADVGETVVQVYKQFTRITGDDKDVSSYDMMPDPTYIPEGYVKEESLCVEINGIKKLVYSNDGKQFLKVEYILSDGASVFQADDEQHISEQVKIYNVYSGMFFEAMEENALNVLLWNNGNIWYRLEGDVVKEELLQIAESIMN